MKKRTMLAAALACLLLGGCASLLERDYSVVEPYANRYWDTSAEDTLRAESYQDLVNSLLLLVEQRAEEGTIRCYGEASAAQQTQAASREVRLESTLGSYLLRRITYSCEAGAGYSTVRVQMTYREDAEDVENMMTLSDSQSLVDLLRLAVREEHERLTARFSYDMPRQDVTAAVESLWRELCGEEAEAQQTLEAPPPEDQTPQDPEEPVPAEPSGSFQFVLSRLYAASEAGTPMGRETLLREAREARVPLSQREVRDILADMAAQGLARVSRGRGGSQLTPKGRALWENGQRTNRLTN